MDFTTPQHEAWIKKEMGFIGLRLKCELEEKSVLNLDPINDQKKSISTTRNFPKQIADFDLLTDHVATFAAVCAEQLRQQNSCCHTIIVMLVIDKHTVETSKYYFNIAVTIPFETNSTLTVDNTAIDMLKKLHKGNENLKFKKARNIVTKHIDGNKKQLQLFPEENPKQLAFMKAIDKLNN